MPHSVCVHCRERVENLLLLSLRFFLILIRFRIGYTRQKNVIWLGILLSR